MLSITRLSIPVRLGGDSDDVRDVRDGFDDIEFDVDSESDDEDECASYMNDEAERIKAKSLLREKMLADTENALVKDRHARVSRAVASLYDTSQLFLELSGKGRSFRFSCGTLDKLGFEESAKDAEENATVLDLNCVPLTLKVGGAFYLNSGNPLIGEEVRSYCGTRGKIFDYQPADNVAHNLDMYGGKYLILFEDCEIRWTVFSDFVSEATSIRSIETLDEKHVVLLHADKLIRHHTDGRPSFHVLSYQEAWNQLSVTSYMSELYTEILYTIEKLSEHENRLVRRQLSDYTGQLSRFGCVVARRPLFRLCHV